MEKNHQQDIKIIKMEKDISYMKKDIQDIKKCVKELHKSVESGFREMHNRYASKWVEKAVLGLAGAISLSILYALIELVLK